MPDERPAVPDDPDGDGPAILDEPERPIEPGSPSAENVLFVLLGVLGALAVLWRLVLLFG